NQSSTPRLGIKQHIWKCREECNDIAQRNITLARIGMPNWLAAMREHEQLVLAHNLHNWHQQVNIAQLISLPMRHQLTQAYHARLGAAFQFTYGPWACRRLKHCHTVNMLRVAAHGINDVTIR